MPMAVIASALRWPVSASSMLRALARDSGGDETWITKLYDSAFERATDEDRALVEARIANGGWVSHEVVEGILDLLCEEASGSARRSSSSSS